MRYHEQGGKVGRTSDFSPFFPRQSPKLTDVPSAFGTCINILPTRHKMSTTAAKTSARKTATKKETVASTPAAVAATPVAAPVAAAVAAPAPVAVAEAAPAAVAAPEVDVVAEFNSLVTKVSGLREVFASVLSDMKKLEKRIPRELKKASKKRKGKAADGTDKPKRDSIFKKPVQISDELCTFLGKPKGTLMSRSDVTSAVCTYAKTKGLMNKQVINADASLRKLLKITEKDELMILNLQRFLKQHYIKAAVPTA